MELTADEIATIRGIAHKRIDECVSDIESELTELDNMPSWDDLDEDDEAYQTWSELVEAAIVLELCEMYNLTKTDN